MKNALHHSLKRLIEEGGNHNFLIINLTENYYIQAAGKHYSSHLLIEAVSNNYLPSEKKLNSSQQENLLLLGWDAPKKEGNYTFRVSINSNEEYNACIEFIEKTAKEVYEVDFIDNCMIELNLE